MYGTITSPFIELSDCFGCEVEINGKGLKDLVINYPFVFEVVEVSPIYGIGGEMLEGSDNNLEILSPEKDSPIIGVIDSGIMEEHALLHLAIDKENSTSLVENEESVADYVQNGGHGTRVTSAILYPNGISNIEAPYTLPCFIRNIRVLDKYNELIGYPPILMQEIVDNNSDCKVFNLSITENKAHERKHMSNWAAKIDEISNRNGILFVISTGNIPRDIIQNYISSGKDYPEYLKEKDVQIASPSQSSFSLAVGSINHTDLDNQNWKSLGGKDNISAFSRVGTALWGKIKPDVVEYGGGLNVSKSSSLLIKEHPETSPELLRSTMHGGTPLASDIVGTSFSAPKVASVVAELLKIYPDEDINLLRALVVQGARLPEPLFSDPTLFGLCCFGYGIPSLSRTLKNDDYRSTFYNSNYLKAEDSHIYSIKIPPNMLNPSNEFKILIEVTLAYSAKVRKTRQKTKSYLGTWLDWQSSKFEETLSGFRKRSLKDDEEIGYKDTNDSIPWTIRERKDWGAIKGVRRNNSTLQKYWVVLDSYQLPEEICFSIKGHKGWDKNFEKVPYTFVVSFEMINQDIPIYESIRIENEIEIEV